MDASEKYLGLSLFRAISRTEAISETNRNSRAASQKTHEFVVASARTPLPRTSHLNGRSPLRFALTRLGTRPAAPFLSTPEAEDPNTDYIKLVRAAIEGDDTFEKKREVIDEYGWRNFGASMADHEAVDVKKASGVSHDPAARCRGGNFQLA